MVSEKDRKKYMKRLVNVFISSSMAAEEKLSRAKYLEFINTTFKKYKYRALEELKNGEAYAVLFNHLFPNTIPEKAIQSGRIQDRAKMLVNWKLIQAAFKFLEVDKLIEVEKIVDGNLRENFDFLQWYKKFYSRNIFLARAEAKKEQGKGRERMTKAKNTHQTERGEDTNPDVSQRYLQLFRGFIDEPEKQALEKNTRATPDGSDNEEVAMFEEKNKKWYKPWTWHK